MARLAATHKRAKTVLAGLDRARGPAPITDPLSRGFGIPGGADGLLAKSLNEVDAEHNRATPA
jgi:hypothetical protein